MIFLQYAVCIVGILKLDISPPGDKPPYCLTSELQQVIYIRYFKVKSIKTGTTTLAF